MTERIISKRSNVALLENRAPLGIKVGVFAYGADKRQDAWPVLILFQVFKSFERHFIIFLTDTN